MSGSYTARGNNAGPATDLFPLSGATASSPAITITATTATGGGTVLHTADANAQDVMFVRFTNFSVSTLVGFVQIGSLATTGTLQVTVNSGAQATVFAGDMAISKSGVVGAWTTATTGLAAYGYVARTYTATG